MSAKVANLIAIETGILIGILSWLVYSHLPSADPGTAVTTGEKIATPVTAAAPISEPGSQSISAAEHSADREQARLMAERAASLQSYYLALARDAGTRPAYASQSVVADTPSYAVTEQPEAVPEYVAPSSTFIYYGDSVPAVIVPRHVGNRCPPTRHRDTRSSNLPLRAGPSILTLRNGGLAQSVPRENLGPPRGFKPPGGIVSQVRRPSGQPIEDGKRSIK